MRFVRSSAATAGLVVAALVLTAARPAAAQATPRDVKVRKDKEAFKDSKDWFYNDLAEGVRRAKAEGKPVLVVFRCIPCEACQEFDDDVARRDPVIRDMLDRFVCVRIPQANAIDLQHFQYDFDQSFAVVMMNPDYTVYGRFATRSDREEVEDISLKGMRKAMEGALKMHANYEAVKPSLAGKQPRPTPYRTPLDYPSLAGRYTPTLNYEGQVAKSCVHCHQVGEAQRLIYRSEGKPVPDEVLYPYPDPEVLGLKMDPTETAKVEQVRAGSIAEKAGLRVGDSIATLAGQPLLSTADLQWVLHNTGPKADLPAKLERDGKTLDVTLRLDEGWRRGNISWRPTSWDLRRMALGGLRLDDLTDAQRKETGLATDVMALKVRHVGQYGAHAVAQKAGFKVGDILVAFDGKTGRLSESDLFALGVQKKRPGDQVAVTVLRGGKRQTLKFTLQ
ncbi:MAG: Trx7/PDZ domain-containing (seleno)protein [Isosphaeraceae bacterium]